MAITKIVSPTSPAPLTVDDWTNAVAQITALKTVMSGQQMVLTEWTNTTTCPKIALGAYLHHLGSIYVVDTEDYTITAPSSDGTYYIKIVVSGSTLAVSFISDISGYAWSSAYNGLYAASDDSQVLPYKVVVGGTVSTFTKYRMLNPHQNAGHAFVDYLGVLNATAINTGNGANELYAMDQNVRTTDSPAFVDIVSNNEVSSGTTVEYATAGSNYTTLGVSEYQKVGEYMIGYTKGHVLLSLVLQTNPINSTAKTVYYKVVVDSVVVEESTVSIGTSSVTVNISDISVVIGSVIQLFLYMESAYASSFAVVSGVYIKVASIPVGILPRLAQIAEDQYFTNLL